MELPIFNNCFWNMVKRIDELSEMISLESFVAEYATEDFNCEMVFDVLSFLGSLGLQVQIEEIKGEKFLLPNKRNERVNFDLSISEWLALQAHFPVMKQMEGRDFHKSLSKKFAEINAKHPSYNLFGGERNEAMIYNFKESLSKKHKKFVDIIDDSFKTQGLVLLEIDGKKFEVFPHKLIMLEGELSIIGEEAIDRCLISYTLSEVTEVKANSINDYIPNYSRLEVDEFVMAIRAVSGREERLVLKIDQNEAVDLNPAYQFLGHPYMTANADGDFIWAASVEVSSELYDWLISMDNKIEILDPVDLKSEFEKYREIKIEDMNRKKLKKAS